MIRPRTMPGVLELLPEEERIFQAMLGVIRDGFQRYGYLPIETPTIELSEILLTKEGGETERQVYFVLPTGALPKQDEGGIPELALRFDLTVPLARYVAEHEREILFPFRRHQIQTVYRGERAQRGRFREFVQCDADVVTRDRLALDYEAEMIGMIHTIFSMLGIGAFRVTVNHRKLLRGILLSFGVREERQRVVLREIDKLDKRSPEEVQASLCGGEAGLTPEVARQLLATLDQKSRDLSHALDLLTALRLTDELAETGRRELVEIFETLKSLGVPETNVILDLTIARGLDYYTGTIFETRLVDHPEIGSVASGGRYDDLAGHYTKSHLPGVGFSIGATRLFWQLREVQALPRLEVATTDVLLALVDEEDRTLMRRLARELRAEGLRVESVFETGKLDRQLRRADRLGIRWVVFSGAEERSDGTVSVKDLRTGKQERMSPEQLVTRLSTPRTTLR